MKNHLVLITIKIFLAVSCSQVPQVKALNHDSSAPVISAEQPQLVNSNHHPQSSVVVTAAAAAAATSPLDKKPRCQEITIPMCKTIRYNYTEMPNSFNHETQEEAGLEVHQYWPLVEIKCSDDLKFFICSLYVPICMEDYAGTVPPCRSVCERARAGCEPVMTQYGFFWPERMACEQFPKFGKHSICMDEKGGELPSSSTTNTVTTILKSGGVAVGTKGSSSGGVSRRPIGGTIGNRSTNNNCINKKCKCEYPLVTVDHQAYVQRSSGLWGDSSNNSIIVTGTTPHCLFPCRGYGYSSQEEIRFANYWLTFWSSFTASVSTLTILTYLIDSTRFNYPERPIICISFCYIFVSIGYLIRIYVGHSEIACGGPNSPVVRYPGTIVTPYQTPSPVCTLVFLLTYYFTIAGSCWYVVLTITWYLASVLKWGTEAISEKSGLFHAGVWVSSALITLTVLLSDSIDGDSISGICFVGNQHYWNLVLFVLAPLGGLLVLGGLFLVTGFIALVKIRSVIAREVRNYHKLEKLMIRIGVFGVLYSVNVCCVIGAFLYEAWVRDEWVNAVNCGGNNACTPAGGGSNSSSSDNRIIIGLSRDEKPAYSVLMIKYFMTLATGITSSIWVFSSKTVETWKKFLSNSLLCYFCCYCNNKASCCCRDKKNSAHPHQTHSVSSSNRTTTNNSILTNNGVHHNNQHHHSNNQHHHHHHLHTATNVNSSSISCKQTHV